MKTRDSCIILVRAFAIWMLFQSIFMLEQIPIALFNPMKANDSFTRFYAVMNAFNLVLYLSLGLVLLLKAESAANLLARGIDYNASAHVGMNDPAIVSFGVAGLFVFRQGYDPSHQLLL